MRAALLLVFAPLLGLFACEGPTKPHHGGEGGSAGGSAEGGGGGCALGATLDGTGTCTVFGLPACAELFRDGDGVCRPSIHDCPKGTIPLFEEGCVPVGIAGCAPEFVEDDGICHPASAKCGEGEIALPQEGCVPIDGPSGCGTGTWGDIPDGPKNVYVDADYAGADSDGSKTKPWKTIAEALAVVDEGGLVALAAGSYAEPLALSFEVTIAGRCPSKVTIAGTDADPEMPKAIHVTAGPVTLRGLRVSADGVGVFVEDAEVQLERVVVEGALGGGVTAVGAADVRAEGSVIAGTRKEGKGRGVGLRLEGGAKASFEGSAIVANQSAGVFVDGKGTRFTAHDVLIEGTRETPSGDGQGVLATGHGEVELTDVAVRDNLYAGVDAARHGTIHGTRVLLEANQSSERSGGGFGGVARLDGELLLEKAALLENQVAGILAGGAKAKLLGSFVADSAGVLALQGEGFEITDSVFYRNPFVGIEAPAFGKTSLRVTRVLIEDSLPEEGEFGFGIVVGGPVELTLDRVVIEGARVAALLVADESSADVSRSVFGNTTEGTFRLSSVDPPIHGAGDGIVVTNGSRLTIRDARIEGCARAGLLYDESAGRVERTLSTGNRYGIVLEGSPSPTIDERTAFPGNEEEQLSDTTLDVPKLPATLPE